MIGLVVALALAQDGGALFLHGISLETSLPADAGWSEATLSMKAPAALPLFLKRRGAKAVDGGVTVDLSKPAVAADKPVARHRAATWMIDWKEKAFAPVFEQLAGKPKTPEALTAFAAGFIERKSMRRGFDLASQVAKSHEGDCTEHAVFLAALLRQAGHSARVVVGMVVLSFEGRWGAFGHAWTEVWRDGKWAVADAAIPAAMNPLYLPTDEVADEGPGFAVALVPAIQALGLEGLKLERR